MSANCRWPRILCCLGGALLLPLLVVADGGDEADANRRLLDRWRNEPGHHARLVQDLKAFLVLPAERQENLRRLDRELYEENSTTSARLLRALERYADWLGRLSEEDRARVELAPATSERLKQIRQIRERQWVERLPKAVREDLEKRKADPADYRSRIAELRQRERKQRAEWTNAIENWDRIEQQRARMSRFEELKPQIEEFVKDSLTPLLTTDERRRLQQTWESGQGLVFLATMVELADKHPIKLPPSSRTGPTRFEELPIEWRNRLSSNKDWPTAAARSVEGRWPEYARTAATFAQDNRYGFLLARVPLGPCRPRDFTPAVQQFLTQKLLPSCTAEEKEGLVKLEGRWPAYPDRMMGLARAHELRIPGMSLPGEPALWQPFRNRAKLAAETAPQVPDRILREFIRTELTHEEQAKLPSLSLSDPATRERVQELYFQHHPHERVRLMRADQRRVIKGAKK